VQFLAAKVSTKGCIALCFLFSVALRKPAGFEEDELLKQTAKGIDYYKYASRDRLLARGYAW